LAIFDMWTVDSVSPTDKLRSILEEINLQVIRLFAAWFEKKNWCFILYLSMHFCAAFISKKILKKIFRHNWTCKFEQNFFCYFFNNYCGICDHFGHVDFFSEVILTKNLSVRAARSAVFGALHHINYWLINWLIN